MKSYPFMKAGSHERYISLWISGIYVLVGGLWIWLSDLALGALITNPETMTHYAIVKGTAYVAATGLMLFLLIRRGMSAIRKTEQALCSSEERYSELVENANSIILRRDPEGRITFFNEFAQKFFGYGAEEILGKNVVGTIVPRFDTSGNDLEQMIKDIGRDPGRFRNNENENMRRNGERVWIAWTNKAIRDSNGRIVEILSIGNDISERKRFEDALKQSEEKYRLMFENMPDVFYRTDDKGNVAFVSPSVERVFGYTPEEALGKNLATTMYADPEQRKPLLAILEEKGEAKGFEVVLKKKDGSLVWVSSNSRFYRDNEGNVLGVEGIVRDVTEKKLAETRLKQINDYLEDILENSPDAISIVDEHGKFIRFNRMSEKLFGYSLEGMRNDTAFDLYADREERERLLTRLRERGFVRAFEAQILRVDGSIVPVELSISLLKDHSGKNIGSVTIARDLSQIKKTNEKLRREIAERHRIEETLRESENTYRTIFENTGTATVIIEEDTTISLANAEYEKISGYSREELEGRKSWTEFVAANDLSRMKKYHNLRRSRPDSAPRKYEFQFIDRQGNSKTVLATVETIPETKKSVASLIDITEQKKLEEELSKAEKLESVGVLAGGIAHDFNNILGAIMGNVSLAKMDTNGEGRLYNLLEEAERAVLRAKDLTYQLLTFSKGGAPVKKVTSLLEVVREAAGFALRGSNVRCNVEGEEGLWHVEADPGQISQVMNNMLINAKHAMPSGGVVAIRLGNVVLGDDDLPFMPGKYIEISIRDQGTGIPKEHLKKIFDPYFTTKQAGSGLGLATSYSIIGKHRGYITVESELGVGTVFHIYLPAAEERPATMEKPGQESINGQGRILLMDDEEMLRDMAFQMLTRLGYEAVLTKDGPEAVEVFENARASGEPFDGVILDLTIAGGIGGAETIKKLIEIDPTVKAVASSGYSNDPVMAQFEEYGFKGVIAKPYALQELGNVLRKVLSEQG